MTVTDEMIEAASRALCRYGAPSFPSPEQTLSWVDEKWVRFKDEAELALTAALRHYDGESQALRIAELEKAAAAFGRIFAAYKKYVEAVSTYNARRELASAERMRGNWAIKLDEEYHAMADAQSDYHRTVQNECRSALIPEKKEG